MNSIVIVTWKKSYDLRKYIEHKEEKEEILDNFSMFNNNVATVTFAKI